MTPRVLIVGGGIAGLGAAHALQAKGIRADIFERNPRPDAEGTGIYLPANAVRALTMLGFGEAIRKAAHEIQQVRLLDHRGRALIDLAIDDVWGGIGPSVAVRHADLRRILRTDVTVKSFEPADAADYDLVIGADGIRSAVREWVFPDAAAPRPVGELAWRFVVDGYPVEHLWCTWQGKGRTFLAVSLGDGRAYCYADVTAATPPDDWRALFAEFPETVRDLIARAGDVHFGTIEEVFLDDVVRGKTVLIGDAAHSYSPNMAQGAALALEDALVLADLRGDLDAYARRRIDRARWVRDQTRRRDMARHLPPPVRDLVLRRLGPRLFRAAFKPLHCEP
ncbi:monooxygenase [Asanoa ishikariensis]|uniref:2-polyprenyl-6-methoxyphenol hydroxylase n=1 Tax=Asanoa ishikariensis TaxID=137265 RepID=A0A1H3L0D0_9ACTN|nr:FAD-dependent monooxygenase [Asanoa ishikariensis]GIF69601.1 monooxygenase [Asanoa ishikariensis]SDY57344.1 2-polyprenyl-6-methoxyphenol hydroxylase [Asanoa ishikariensis]